MRDFIKIIENSLNEEFSHGFVTFLGKQCEIFKNPSRKEYAQCLDGNDDVRAFLVGDDILIWNTYSALHQMVREELKLPATAISIVLCGRPDSEAYVSVTDNTKGTVWWHNAAVARAIHKNPALNRMFSEIEISYYDEAIVGPWDELDEDE